MGQALKVIRNQLNRSAGQPQGHSARQVRRSHEGHPQQGQSSLGQLVIGEVTRRAWTVQSPFSGQEGKRPSRSTSFCRVSEVNPRSLASGSRSVKTLKDSGLWSWPSSHSLFTSSSLLLLLQVPREQEGRREAELEDLLHTAHLHGPQVRGAAGSGVKRGAGSRRVQGREGSRAKRCPGPRGVQRGGGVQEVFRVQGRTRERTTRGRAQGAAALPQNRRFVI